MNYNDFFVCLEQKRYEDIQVLVIESITLLRALTFLRDYRAFRYDQLIDLTAVDYPTRHKRFELTYHLLSLEYKKRIFIKVALEEEEMVPTITPIFMNANWYEREVWDLMGIGFKDHPDLRRILTDYNFLGHPLRKDFPLTGYTQVHFNKKTHKVENEPVNLQQNYRDFDFVSPWNS